ncbi:MAG: hypothetical protein ACYST0_12980 [Planctomycetota bacterium]
MADRWSVRGTSRETIKAPYRDITRDPREDEGWFQRLPPAVQERTREAWRAGRVQFDPWHDRQRRMRNRCLREGSLACVLPTLFMVGGSAGVVLAAVPAGLATGWLWWRFGAGRMTSGLIAMVAILAAVLVSGLWASRHDHVGFFNTAFGMFLGGLLAAAMGFRRELDRREQAL